MSVEFCSREYWGEYFDDVVDTLKADKEKILDIIKDHCRGVTISIQFALNEVPHYEVNYTKNAINIERLMGKESEK